MLRKNLKEFLPRTMLQPLLLVFVFTYVFPKIGQGVGGGAAGGASGVRDPARRRRRRHRDHLPGHPVRRPAAGAGVRLHEGDRGPGARAAARSSLVALEKIVAGAIQGLIAALLVFPIAAVVPANDRCTSHINWLVLLTLVPLACIMSAALGLMFGTRFEPRTVPMLFGVIVMPLTFLGCIYYPWTALGPISRGCRSLVLVNPLVYMCEGFRGRLDHRRHMSLWVVYPRARSGSAALFL